VATHFEKADKLIVQAESKRNDDPKTRVSLLLKARTHLDLISPLGRHGSHAQIPAH
jgi:hypothetical protein